MKTCPRCKKEVDDQTKVCPHCGYRMSGYQPMRRSSNKRKENKMFYVTLVFFLIFSMFLSYKMNELIYSNSSRQEVPLSKETLGPLGDIKNKSETAIYQWDNLDSLKKAYSNVDIYCKHIAEFENTLMKMTGIKDIEKDYQVTVTDLNNIYFILDYKLINKTETIQVTVGYDIAKTQHDVILRYKKTGYSSFEEMKAFDENDTIVKELYSFLSGKDLDLYQKGNKEFLALEPKFHERINQSGSLGSYGLSCRVKEKNDHIVFKVSQVHDTYSLHIRFEGDFDATKLIQK